MTTVEERLSTLEARVDAHAVGLNDLRLSVVHLEERMDRRFEGVDARFTALEDKMDRRFDAVERRFEAVDAKFVALDAKFAALDPKFAAFDPKFAAFDPKFAAVDAKFFALQNVMISRFDELDTRVSRLTGLVFAALTAMLAAAAGALFR